MSLERKSISRSVRCLLLIICGVGILGGCSATTESRKPTASSIRKSTAPDARRAQLTLAANGDSGLQLGDEYEEYAKPHGSKGGGSGSSSWFSTRSVLLYLPNRFIDLFDVFRADVGVGPAWGAVLRLTRYGQMGYREFSPLSARIGMRGRRAPVFIERTNEFGIGPGFASSPNRKVTVAEVGAGLDLLIAGAYLGISLDELVDFCGGIFGFDISNDDFT